MLENISQEDKSKLTFNQEALERAKQEQLHNQETSPEAIQKKIQEEIQKIEEYSERITDIPEYQEKQIASLGGNEQELANEMANIDTEIKRTKSGFIERTKNYVIGLMAMVASTGNVAASTKQETKAKPETNVIYVDDKNDPRLQKYQDSSALYNNYIDLKSKLKSQKYEKKKEAYYNSPEEALADKAKHDKEHIDGVEATPAKVVQKTKTLKSVNDFIGGVVNPTLPDQLFSDSIKPNGMEQYDYSGDMEGIFSRVSHKERYLKDNAYGDTRIIANYSNVKPKVEVKVKQKTPEPEKKTTVAPKTETVKTTKVETKKDKIIYVEDKKDPRLKEYQDSLFYYKKYNDLYNFTHGPYGNLEKDITEKDFKNYDKNLLADHESKKGLTVRWINNKNEQDWGTINDYLKVKPYLKHVPEKFSKTNYRDTDPFYKKPTIEVKYQPKPKLTEVGLKPIGAVKIPTEQTEVNPLANLKQKEIIKNPEKTGYTVRVGEKLYYLSKEDLNKLESDKTTHYNVSEKGDGTEKRLVWWGGNDQGQNLQQVAERLGIRLPRAFDTQRQEFDK